MTAEQVFEMAESFRLSCNCKTDVEAALVEAAALEAAYHSYYQGTGSFDHAIEVGMSKLIALGAVDSFSRRTARLYRCAFLTVSVIARAGDNGMRRYGK